MDDYYVRRGNSDRIEPPPFRGADSYTALVRWSRASENGIQAWRGIQVFRIVVSNDDVLELIYDAPCERIEGDLKVPVTLISTGRELENVIDLRSEKL